MERVFKAKALIVDITSMSWVDAPLLTSGTASGHSAFLGRPVSWWNGQFVWEENQLQHQREVNSQADGLELSVSAYCPLSLLHWLFNVDRGGGYYPLWTFMQSVEAGQFLAPHQVSTGVPQGPVLGPLLFGSFTTLMGLIIRSPHHCSADDIQLWLSSPNSTHLSLIFPVIIPLYPLFTACLVVGNCNFR